MHDMRHDLVYILYGAYMEVGRKTHLVVNSNKRGR